MDQLVDNIDVGILYLSIVGLVITLRYAVRYKFTGCKLCPWLLGLMLYTQVFYVVAVTWFESNVLLSDVSDLNYDLVFLAMPIVLTMCRFREEKCSAV